MYINSNFSDYYDFCTKYGQDSKIVYNRKTSKIPTVDKTLPGRYTIGGYDVNDPSQFLKLCAIVIRELNPSKTYRLQNGWTSNAPISFYCVGGHPYFLIHETHAVVSFAEAYAYKNDRLGKRFKYLSNYSTAVCNNFEANCKPEKLMALHAHLDVPLFGLNYRGVEHSDDHNCWVLNPCLKDMKFPVDPVVVYTQIFNSLQAPELQTVEVQNKYKVLSHGMDNASFKRESGGPTRKRKKIQLG